MKTPVFTKRSVIGAVAVGLLIVTGFRGLIGMTWNLAAMNGLAAAAGAFAVSFGLRGGLFHTPMRKFGLKHRIQMIAFAVIFWPAFSVNNLGIELDRAASFGLMFLFMLGGFAVFWLGMIVGTLERSQGTDATDERLLPLAGPMPNEERHSVNR